jgi:hypothetical protein
MTRARLVELLTKPAILFLGLYLFSVITYTAGLARVQSILWGDTRYYYTYTASLLLDRDINFSNQAYLPDVGFPHPPVVSQVTHLVTNKFSPGAPLSCVLAFGKLLEAPDQVGSAPVKALE